MQLIIAYRSVVLCGTMPAPFLCFVQRVVHPLTQVFHRGKDLSMRLLVPRGKVVQFTLAEKMNVKPQQVNKWVKGRENFTIETLATLSEVLGFDLITVSNDQDAPTSQLIQL